jgi:hypothetical protein
MLNNFAMSQQRALQAMRDKCNKLKKKNETLEEFINTSEWYTPLVGIDILNSRRHSAAIAFYCRSARTYLIASIAVPNLRNALHRQFLNTEKETGRIPDE